MPYSIAVPYTASKKGQGAFYVHVREDGAAEASWEPDGSTVWKFPDAQAAYDHFYPFAQEGNHAAWNICYHLQDVLTERRRPNRALAVNHLRSSESMP